MPSIPHRWIPYKPCGSVIEGTNIICFKVPLRKSVQQHVSQIKVIWDINKLLSTIPQLGAVIDLTNTDRYYDPQELLAAGVLHKKILLPGRDLPSQEKVTEFFDAMDEFRRLKKDMIIGVHCTHGLNRTGYMVCRYMRDVLNIEGKEVLDRFQRARGYEIERPHYVADILGEEIPPLPDFRHHAPIKPVPSNTYHQNDNRPDRKPDYPSWRRRPGEEATNSEIRHRRRRKNDSSNNSSHSEKSSYKFDYRFDY